MRGRLRPRRFFSKTPRGAFRLAFARLAGASALAAGATAVFAVTPASAQSTVSSITLSGHGYGHGIGMGQYGAIGYALMGSPWTYQNILSHYYGGTTLGTMPTPNPNIRVVLTWNDNNPIRITSQSSFSVAGVAFSANQVAMLSLNSSGSWSLARSSSCSGPWSAVSSATYSTTQAVAIPASQSPTASVSQVLTLCNNNGGTTPYRGEIQAASYNGSPRTVNVLPLNEYLAGVVPSEMPGSWGNLGPAGPQSQPWGFQALEAQAVAARSYAEARLGSLGYADICDSTYCQEYLGMSQEYSQATAAVNDTSGVVLYNSGGAIASAMYSASTGGYTAGGPFPAVPDAGDAVCNSSGCNPYHNWSVTITASQIEQAWPQFAQVSSVTITSRNGYGDWGGRVLQMSISGLSSSGQATSVSITGNQFMWDMGLKSNYFTISSVAYNAPLQPSGTAGYDVASSSGPVNAYGADTSYGPPAGTKLASAVVAMVPTPTHQGYWLITQAGNVYNFGDAKWFGSLAGVKLAAPVAAAGATPDGAGYWLVTQAGNVYNFGDAKWYGSLSGTTIPSPITAVLPSHDGAGYLLVAASGATYAYGDATSYGPGAGITLPSQVVAAASTPDGAGYWLVTQAGNVYNFGDAKWYGSLSGTTIPSPVVDVSGTSDGAGYWLVTQAGNVYNFGDASWQGSPSASKAGGSWAAIAAG